ncbi:MAG: nitrobenzoate reductase [Gammaproteobacteria bacterium]|nr:MAG: nitrobenzoate reductase [Gammaproteobacteria bacterium]PIE36089.1 MAG: nitrobenzoate reductase [Gammaproteobacteria bacterium]
MTEGLVNYGKAASTSDAVQSRRSLRAFLPEDVPDETLRYILDTAQRAPSGTNMQPWHTLVVRGATREKLCDAACAAFDDPAVKPECTEPYYPETWFSPYVERRRKVGWDLYGLLGIGKGDKDRMHAQHRRNYRFFDAPVGLIFTIHRDLATGSWLDYGMYLQNIMLLAREAGLHTCPQAAWADYHAVIREVLPVDDDHHVVCGMSLGYADPDAVENSLLTERAPIEETVRFFD